MCVNIYIYIYIYIHYIYTWTHLQIMGEPVQSDDGVTEIVLRPTLYQNVTTVEDAERSRKAGVEHLISSLTWDLRHMVRQVCTRTVALFCLCSRSLLPHDTPHLTV